MRKTKTQIVDSLDTFTRAYLECALWSSTDNSDDSGGDPMDQNYSIEDFTRASLLGAIRDCRDFQSMFILTLAPFDKRQAGFDFWLNRNGHGAGFWDGDYPEPIASLLDKGSHSFGSIDLYVHRGRIYGHE